MKLKVRNVLKILSIAQKKKALNVIALVTIGMVLETVGVGAIIPLIALISDTHLTESYPAFQGILSMVGNPDHATLCLYAVSILVSIYLVKTIFLSISIKKETAFIFSLQQELSNQLFSTYMYQPYTFHLDNNSSRLIQNILAEVNVFVFKIVSPLMKLVSESFLLVSLSLLLLLIEPLGSITVLFLLGVTGYSIHRFTRKNMSIWGKNRQSHEALIVQHLQQGLGGIKDTILLGQEENFIDHVAIQNARRVAINSKEIIYQQYPRLWIELIAVIGLGILVFSMIFQEKPVGTIVPTLGVFAAAAFRLMPSVNRFLVSIQSIKFGTPVVDPLLEEFSRPISPVASSAGKNLELGNIIEIKNLCYHYPSSPLQVLNGVSINIKKGDSIGIIGESGSGKSTLVDCVLGLLKPYSGSIEVDGHNIHSDLRAWQRQVGYVSQSIYLSDDTLRNNIAYGIPSYQIDQGAVNEAVRMAQLDNFVKSLPDGLETMVGERGVRLSGGQRQRIGIARALYHNPTILVLDEATSALDITTEKEVMKSVFDIKGKKTLVIIAHRLSTVASCDRIYHMGGGMILEEGSPSEIISKIELTTKS